MADDTNRIGLKIPDYQDQRWDIPTNENWNKVDDLHGMLPESFEKLIASANVVDVFDYFVADDSDGGEWTKRMQDTSWYNEELNTATRGRTRDIPAHVKIVAGINRVAFFDATEPDMPMWRVFNTGNGNLGICATGFLATSVSMLNGILCVTQRSASAGAINIVNFISDSGSSHRESGATTLNGLYKGNIAQSNDLLGYGPEIFSIVNQLCNDVAMTVLPDAPIDQATGIAVPYKTVATEAGGSWILDDSTISATGAIAMISTDINSDGMTLWASTSNIYVFNTIPNVDTALTSADYIFDTAGTSGPHISGVISAVVLDGSDIYVSTDEGLFLVKYNTSTPASSMVIQIDNAFMSGWKYGDIELCLSGENLIDKSINAIIVTDNGTATFASVGTNTDLQATTATGGTITTTVPTGQVCYGWELISGDWLFRETIGDFVGISETGGTLTIADGTTFTLLKYTSGTPSVEQLIFIPNDEKKLFEDDAKFLLPSANVQAIAHDLVTDTKIVGTDNGSVKIQGLVKIETIVDSNLTSVDVNSVSLNRGSYTIGTAAEAAAHN